MSDSFEFIKNLPNTYKNIDQTIEQLLEVEDNDEPFSNCLESNEDEMSESSHRSLKRPSLLETPQSLIFTGTEDNNPGRSIRRRVDYRSPISRTSFRSTGSPEEWMGSPFSGERHEFELEARPTRNSPYNTGNSTHNTRNSVYSTGNSTQSTGTIERNIASLHISQYPLTQPHQERRAPHNQNSNYNASNSTRRLSNSLPSENSIPTVIRELEKISINEREYTIFKEIGKGSSGKVYQVISHTKGEIYALKVIEIKNPEDRKNTLNEIELLESLNKEKNIISLIDHYTTASTIYMVMEYGEIDLATLIRNHSTNEWDINFITYYWGQMLHAVRAIHTKNIVHSDLKPANFVLSKGRLKLIDFGIAKKHADDTANIHRDIQVGTINYMSPEALSGINEDINEAGKNVISLGAPSDVWSLGCILYQMVYGKTPFYHMTITQKVANIPNPSYQIRFPKQVVFGTDNVIMNIPKSLINVMSRCLDRRPDMRPSMFELQKNLLVNDTFN